ncbi:hypothetical protein [Mucilaginibacter sp.]|uniref:hypothetical protein n=1 Tax=Mucilaginibacter sp. TaxID=1882438 RepID=UPI0032651D7E
MSVLSIHTEQRVIDVMSQCLNYFELLSLLKMTAEDDSDAKQAQNCLRRIINDRIPRPAEVIVVNSMSFIVEDLYRLVQWPWVQELMEYEWFRQECYLHQAFDDQPYFDSAYFVPIERIIEINKPGL